MKKVQKLIICHLLMLPILFSSEVYSTNIDSLELEILKIPGDTGKYKFMLHLSEKYFYTDIESSKYFTEKALAFTKKNNIEVGVGSSYDLLGIINTVQGNYSQSIKSHNAAINILSKIEKPKLLAKSYSNLSICYQQMGELEKAISYQIKSLKIEEQYSDSLSLALSYNNLGVQNQNLSKFDKAKKNYIKALDYLQNIDDPKHESMITNNLGLIYLELNKKDSARILFEKSLKISKSINSEVGIAHSLNYIGNLHYDENDYITSKKLHLQALPAIESSKSEYYTIIQYIYLAQDYVALSKTDSSQYYLQKVINSGDQYKSQLMDAYTEFTKLYIKTNQVDSALHYFEKTLLSKDELFQLNKTEITERIETEFETEKKEKEISLLKEKDKVSQLEINQKDDRLKIRTYFIAVLSLIILLLIIISLFIYRQIKLKQQKKSAELEHRALRTQMNPHFVFNALNSIQRMYLEGNVDKASSFMSDFGELMRKILENSNHFTISLKEEIETLEYYLNLEKLRCQDKFTYNIDIDPSIDLTTTKVPPLILQPFVENAIWHGILPKEGNGQINISISKEKNKLKFKIQDDGVGIQEKNATDHQSKGIEITEQRIGSKVRIESKVNESTTITFYLKVD